VFDEADAVDIVHDWESPQHRPKRCTSLDSALSTLERDEHGQQILLAWIAKEKLRDLIRLRPNISGQVPTAEQIRHALYEFLVWCATYDHIPELITLARIVDRWREEIINAVLLGVSNARSEGLNRVIKLEGRMAYGFRSAVNQRRRLRYATTRSACRPPRTVTTSRSRKVIKHHGPG
jgi:transposase